MALSNRQSAATSQHEEKLIEEVIFEAKKKFIAGYELNKNLKSQLSKDPTLCDKVRSVREKFIQYKDELFPSWDANRIEGTPFIASQGPQDKCQAAQFIAHTAFNKRMSIQHIVGLGHCLAYDSYSYKDFYDYCIKSREEHFESYEDEEPFEAYKATIKKISGEHRLLMSGQQIIQGVIRSCLLINSVNEEQSTEKQLHVTLIDLEDNCSLNLSEETKEALWQIYQTSLRESILIHCASGVGRTGHLILTLEILKNYDQLFVSNDLEKIATGILDIVERIRRNRPALIAVNGQFEEAIRNANIMRQYALEKGYIKSNTAANTSTMGLFAIKQTETSSRNIVSAALKEDSEKNVTPSMS